MQSRVNQSDQRTFQGHHLSIHPSFHHITFSGWMNSGRSGWRSESRMVWMKDERIQTKRLLSLFLSLILFWFIWLGLFFYTQRQLISRLYSSPLIWRAMRLVPLSILSSSFKVSIFLFLTAYDFYVLFMSISVFFHSLVRSLIEKDTVYS